MAVVRPCQNHRVLQLLVLLLLSQQEPYKDQIDVVTNGLYIKKVFPYDSGTYMYKVTSQYRKLTDRVEIQLHVKAPPSEPFSVIVDNPTITRRQGTSADLLCRHSPDFGPNPIIAWVFKKPDGSRDLVSYEGQVIGEYRKRIQIFPWGLRIRKARVKDSGIYKCMVWSKVGVDTDDAEITLHVRRFRR